MSILAEADGEIGQGVIPDARAAARIISCMDGLLPAVKLDPEPLHEEAQRIESQIREMMAVHLNPPQDSESVPSGMYG
jgi:predicted ATP-grasp superfamily ATP-dependent carboligase